MRALLVVLVLWLGLPLVADAQQRVHVVRSGQSLARIAQRYDVAVADLAAANGIRRDAQLRVGQQLTLPESNVVYVRSGQTLAEIANRANCSVTELVRINRLRQGTQLRVGQRILLPGYEAPRGSRGGNRWGRARNPGVVTFYRVATRQRTRIRVLDTRGRAARNALRRMSDMMRPRGSRPAERFPSPPPRLAEIIARVSDHFGGRVVHVISGFRHAGGNTRESSQHLSGHALDIHVAGVPNTELRDFLRTFDRVGVGYYPRSSFVHIDVREQSAFWVDWSRPGEAPRYQRRGEPPPADAEGSERQTEGGDDGSAAGESASEVNEPSDVDAPAAE